MGVSNSKFLVMQRSNFSIAINSKKLTFFTYFTFLSTITIKVISSFKDMETSQERLFFQKHLNSIYFRKK